jgi:hypothetical protein
LIVSRMYSSATRRSILACASCVCGAGSKRMTPRGGYKSRTAAAAWPTPKHCHHVQLMALSATCALSAC